MALLNREAYSPLASRLNGMGWMSLAPVIDPPEGVIAGVIEPGDRGGL
jgi:hypothetical protein